MAVTVCLAQPARSETIAITLDKTEALRLDRPVSSVLVGNPAIVAVAVETVRIIILTGKMVGETNLLLLDRRGNEIVNYDIVVAPEMDRSVTIHRSTAAPATLSCDPRCVGVTTPSGSGSDKPALPKSGGASPAPAKKK